MYFGRLQLHCHLTPDTQWLPRQSCCLQKHAMRMLNPWMDGTLIMAWVPLRKGAPGCLVREPGNRTLGRWAGTAPQHSSWCDAHPSYLCI